MLKGLNLVLQLAIYGLDFEGPGLGVGLGFEILAMATSLLYRQC